MEKPLSCRGGTKTAQLVCTTIPKLRLPIQLLYQHFSQLKWQQSSDTGFPRQTLWIQYKYIVLFWHFIVQQVAEDIHDIGQGQFIFITGNHMIEITAIELNPLQVLQSILEALGFLCRQGKVAIPIGRNDDINNLLHDLLFQCRFDFFLQLAIFLDEIDETLDLSATVIGDTGQSLFHFG